MEKFVISKELIDSMCMQAMRKKGISDSKVEEVDLIKATGLNTMGQPLFPTYSSILALMNDSTSFITGSASRNIIHLKDFGFSHFSSRIWGVDEKDFMLFQLRGYQKDHNAGLLDAPISGHIWKVAKIEGNTKREFEEETGLDVNKEIMRLWHISKKHDEYFDPHTKTDFSDKEFVFEHLWAIKDAEELLNKLSPQEAEGRKKFEEVAGFFLINVNDLKDLMEGRIDNIPEIQGITKHGKTIYENVTTDCFANKDHFFYNKFTSYEIRPALDRIKQIHNEDNQPK